MSIYTAHFSTRVTPQSEPIPGSHQVKNSAGGYAFPVNDWTRLDRFLILGNEGGSYYATEKALTVENAQAVLRCANEDMERTVRRIAEISEAGRAPKNDPAIFALAMCAGVKGKGHVALAAVPSVCRIGTHLFQFLEAVEKFRGHGRSLNRALTKFYTEKDVKSVAYQLVKYQQRNGWAHRDVLRLCKPKVDGSLSTAFQWAVANPKKPVAIPADFSKDDPLAILWAFEKAKKASKEEIVRLILDHNLPREAIPTQHLTDASIWEALLEKMPMTAMVRNLATMTRIGLLAPMSKAVGKVLTELDSAERIKKSKLHPVAILAALLTYKQGHGERGGHTWTPVTQIVDALDGAFYKAFGNVESTGKRWLIGVDISGSMDGGTIAGVPGLTPRVGAAALALVTAATEKQHHIVGFTNGGSVVGKSMHSGFTSGITPLAISPRQRLDDVCQTMRAMPMGGTDCALPMLYALEKKIPVDMFLVITDNETWAGSIHPTQALRQYREKMGIPAKSAVIGMTASAFSIADPDDAGQMDCVGFDTATPAILADFAK